MDKILRLPEVMARVGLKKTALYEQIARKSFPSPVSLTDEGRAVGWKESAITDWLAKRPAVERIAA